MTDGENPRRNHAETFAPHVGGTDAQEIEDWGEKLKPQRVQSVQAEVRRSGLE